MKCGLLGRKLSHSYSPLIHATFGDYSYSLFEQESDQIELFLRTQDFRGINVTIPYKKTVIPYCKELSDTAGIIGAVNTIVRKPDGSLIGHNTDYFGFSYLLAKSGLHVENKKVLVLGTGGASVTVQKVLEQFGANIIVISRTGKHNYENIHLHRDAAVIINCTPVGMSPECPVSPLSLEGFEQLEGVLDLIYNPSRTGLLMEAEERGLVAVNGLWMLVAQAKESAEWFLGHKLSDDLIEKTFYQLKSQTENIILVGMPGCGKSTVAKLLAEKLSKTFLDADQEIVRVAGKSIPEIFEEGGEDLFRSIESQVLKSIGKLSGCVIATGGGCVTKPENYSYLHQNGTIFHIVRDIDLLPTDGRPLSRKDNLQEMYRTRLPLYRKFADHEVDNNHCIDFTVDSIIQILRSGGAI